MPKSAKIVQLFPLLILSLLILSGCRQGNDFSDTNISSSQVDLPLADNPDAYMEVDCLLPGQVRKLGSMIYQSPRRPVKNTANECTIRGGEYVVYDRANYKESLAVWLVEAESGDPVAQTYVGEIYIKSPPGKPRYDLAAKWFKRAAKQGHKRAQLNLGYLYEHGFGVPVDMDKAADWYGIASGQDSKNIVQQYQLTAEERAEFEELKEKNAAQITELQELKNEIKITQTSLSQAQENLENRNSAIKLQQQDITKKLAAAKILEQQLSAKATSSTAGLQAELATLKKGLRAKEQELSKQKTLAHKLSDQINTHKVETKDFQTTLAELNKKLSDLPGPKIEVFDPQLLRTRGIIIAPVDKGDTKRVVTGKVWSPAGLQYVKINGSKTTVKPDGKFRAIFPMQSDKLSIHIVATDNNGKIDEMEFTLQQRKQSSNTNESEREAGATDSPKINFGRYYALIIGNNEYKELPKLKTAVEDAKEVGALLKEQYNFEVTTLYNANRNTILSTLNSFRKRLTEHDNFLIYYAGHGTLEERNTQGFWLPVDSSLDDDVNWIPTDRITGIMNLMSAKQIMVVADACYSGIMTRASLTRLESGKSTEAYNKWLKKMAAYKSRVIISSGETKPVLDGGGGKHSIFAKALLETLRNNDKILLGIDLHRAIAALVVDASARLGQDQVPQYAGLNRAGHELGDFLFIPKKST